MARAQITVSRTLEGDIGLRRVTVSLDDQPLAALTYGQSVTQEIDPGPHRLRADNTLVRKTLDFVVRDGEHVRFVTANRAGFGSWLVWLIGAGPIYLTLERQSAAATPEGQA